MKLDEKALEAGARKEAEIDALGRADKQRYIDRLSDAIRAYIGAATPPDVAGMVERLEEGTSGTDITKTDPYLNALMRQAATAFRLSAGGGWRTMDGTHVLVYCSRMGEVGEARWHSESFGGRGPTWVIAGFNQSWASEPTHWQPPPVPPTAPAEGA